MKGPCFMQGQFWGWSVRKGAQQIWLQDLSVKVLGLLSEKGNRMPLALCMLGVRAVSD